MRILVLESSPMVRRLIGEELLPSNYEILEAETLGQALDLLTSVEGISLVTTPVVLDDTDGFEFIRQLRSPELRQRLKPLGNHNVPAILVTANDTDADRLRGYQVGAADFIQKPWSRGQLLAHVDSVLGQGDELAGMSVLVADDSRTARSFIRTCLVRLGVTVHEADDGDTALEFLRDHRVDMLLSDLNMVRMHGDALCLKVRSELGLTDLPIIFLSANEDKAAILSLFKLGATDYLKKPFLQEELMARLKVHLEREKLMRTLRHVADIRSQGDSPAPAPSPAAPVLRQGETRLPRILLVDDSPVVLAVGAKLLRTMGCEVEAVAEAAYAVARFTERLHDDPFDLVLMDVQMPGMDGLEATRRIRAVEAGLAGEVAARVPIVAVTAADVDQVRDDCLAAGMDDVHGKPFEADLVREVIDRLIAAQTV